MANRGVWGYLSHSDGTILQDYAGTATFQSLAYPARHDWLGIAQDITVSGGSSPTLDISLQARPVGTTDWFSYSEDKNSATQAALTQITATAVEYQYFINPFPHGGWEWRAVFTKGGTWSTMTITAYYFQRNTAEEMR